MFASGAWRSFFLDTILRNFTTSYASHLACNGCRTYICARLGFCFYSATRLPVRIYFFSISALCVSSALYLQLLSLLCWACPQWRSFLGECFSCNLVSLGWVQGAGLTIGTHLYRRPGGHNLPCFAGAHTLVCNPMPTLQLLPGPRALILPGSIQPPWRGTLSSALAGCTKCHNLVLCTHTLSLVLKIPPACESSAR